MDEVVIRRIDALEVEMYKRIRLLALTDSPTSFGEPLSLAQQRDDADWTEYVVRGSTSDDLVIVVALSGDECVGLAVGSVDVDEELNACRDSARSEITGVYVLPQMRCRGIAQRLMDEVMSWLRQRGVRTAKLSVTETNADARRFYERLGFMVTGEYEPLFSHPELMTFEMSCEL